MSQALHNLRPDLTIIQHWVKPNTEVLDLGCGQGELLSYLKRRAWLWLRNLP
jgi:cyclopropane fatty-acyl-phospholipid synthase-like methyltransferase